MSLLLFERNSYSFTMETCSIFFTVREKLKEKRKNFQVKPIFLIMSVMFFVLKLSDGLILIPFEFDVLNELFDVKQA